MRCLKVNFCLKLFLFLILSSLLIGCAGPQYESRESRGVWLSDAMDKASDAHKGDRNINAPHWTTPENNSAPGLIPSPDPAERPVAVNDKPADTNPFVFGLAGGVGFLKSAHFDPLTFLEISTGKYLDEKNQLDIYAGFGWAPVSKTDDLERSIKDGVNIFSLGMRYKHFFTPQYTFLGAYLTLGAAYTRMCWQYKNSITIDDSEIGSDSLDGYDFFAGVGFNLAQIKHFQIGLEVLPSVTLWNSTTSNGFSNDVFDSFFMIKLKFTLNLLH